ncbi:MAG: hypothetical protein ACOYN4_00935 [Bacteroidales bacterium]
MQKQQKEVNFPENRVYKKLLKQGDYAILSNLSKYTTGTVREVLNGNRRMTDRLKKAFVKFQNDRKVVEQRLKDTITTSDTSECSICHSGKCDSSCSAE